MTLDPTFNLAVQEHQAGRLAAAERLYRQILSQQPNHADALHLLGVVAHQVGRSDVAMDLIDRSLAINPNCAEAHSNRGEVLKRQGKLDDSIAAWRRAIALRFDYADAHYNLGNALKEKGKLDECIAAYRQAIALKPDYFEAYGNLGSVLTRKGRLEEGIAAFRQALVLKPSSHQTHSNLGNALRDNGQFAEAVAACRRAVALKPDYAIAHNNLGNALRDTGQHEEAIAAYRTAVTLKPDYADAGCNLSNALRERGRVDDAMAVCREVIAITPDWPEAHSNLGSIFRDMGEPDQAIAAYRRAIALRPDFPSALTNLGVTLHEKGCLDEGAAACRRAVEVKPDFAEGHCNLGFALLLRGEFSAGWEQSEWRWRMKEFSVEFPDIAARWDGSCLANGTIMLHAEQGFGDTLQFVRYIPLVAQRCRQVVVTCQPELHRLLQSISGARWISPGEPLPPADAECLLLSLPRVFGTTLKTIPSTVPYLKAAPEAVDLWRKRIGEYADHEGEEGVGVSECSSIGVGEPAGTHTDTPTLPFVTRRYAASSAGAQRPFKIGLAWGGRPTHKNDRNRSIALSILAPLASAPGAVFYSLQTGPAAAQAKHPPAGMTLADWTGDFRDFADTAALIANLDLVITVDTAVAHLAGAMGKPVWILLPFIPDWRWLLEREDNPWYPTMRLFRQKLRGNWRNVIEEVAEALRLRQEQ